MPAIRTHAKKAKKSNRRATPSRNRRKAPSLTKAEMDFLVNGSSKEDWNAQDDVDVFTPAKPPAKSKGD